MSDKIASVAAATEPRPPYVFYEVLRSQVACGALTAVEAMKKLRLASVDPAPYAVPLNRAQRCAETSDADALADALVYSVDRSTVERVEAEFIRAAIRAADVLAELAARGRRKTTLDVVKFVLRDRGLA